MPRTEFHRLQVELDVLMSTALFTVPFPSLLPPLTSFLPPRDRSKQLTDFSPAAAILMAPLEIRATSTSGSSSANIGMIIGMVAGAVVALAVLFAIAAALVPGSRVRRYFTAADASGYPLNYRRPVEDRAAARSGIRSTTTRGAANNDTILMRENNGVVMTLDNDTARVASMSPPDEASIPLVHAPASPPDSPTSPSAGHPPSPTAVRFTPAHTPSPAVTASAQDSDPPPPYSVDSSL